MQLANETLHSIVSEAQDRENDEEQNREDHQPRSEGGHITCYTIITLYNPQ